MGFQFDSVGVKVATRTLPEGPGFGNQLPHFNTNPAFALGPQGQATAAAPTTAPPTSAASAATTAAWWPLPLPQPMALPRLPRAKVDRQMVQHPSLALFLKCLWVCYEGDWDSKANLRSGAIAVCKVKHAKRVLRSGGGSRIDHKQSLGLCQSCTAKASDWIRARARLSTLSCTTGSSLSFAPTESDAEGRSFINAATDSSPNRE